MPTQFESLAAEASACTRCGLAEGRTNVVFGMGNPQARLLFVGEGPGAEEDKQGLPFVGRSGKLLDKLLFEDLGVSREVCYIANVVKCRPPGNRDPKPDEIAACRPYLDQQIDLIRPAVVVTLGKFVGQALLNSKQDMKTMRGKEYPFRSGVLIPTYHPAYVLRAGASAMAIMRADLIRAKMALA